MSPFLGSHGVSSGPRGPFPAARMRPLYQWSLSLPNREGLVSTVQVCSEKQLSPPSGCGQVRRKRGILYRSFILFSVHQALVVSTTGGRVALTFLPEDLPSTWEDQESPRPAAKAPRLSTGSSVHTRTREYPSSILWDMFVHVLGLSGGSKGGSETGRVGWGRSDSVVVLVP